MIVYFTDRQLDILGMASTGLPGGFTIIDDKKTEDVESGVAVFECTIPFDHSNRSKIEECTAVGNYILRNHEDEDEFYTIIDAEVDTKNQEVYIYAEDAGLDLLNEVVGEYKQDEADEENNMPAIYRTLAYYIELFAKDSGFEIGVNEAAGMYRSLSWDGDSTVTERLASVATQFDGCEISYRFEIEGLKIKKKYIDIHKERGHDNGVQLRLNKDVDRIVTKKSIANLATALEVVGGTPEPEEDKEEASAIADEEEEERKPITLLGYFYDDGNFYVSGTRLCSREALKKWSRYNWAGEPNQLRNGKGHIVKPFSYDTVNQQELCNRAITELKKISEIEVNYEIDVNFLPDGTKIGDRITIIDDEGELYVSGRILKMETSAVNQSKQITLGEYLILSNGISKKVEELASQFSKNSQSVYRAWQIAFLANTTAKNAQTAVDNLAGSLASTEAAQVIADDSVAEAHESIAIMEQKMSVVETEVASLENTVDNAQAAADNAQLAAETAQTKAKEAAQAAENALADAADANEAAVLAQSKATTATEKAETAEDTAKTAKTDAQTAQATAEAAKLDAEKANQDIASLGENLDTVKTTMEADYARKTELTEATAHLQSQITKNAGEISSTVSKVATVDETANDAKEQAEAAQTVADTAKAQADQALADAMAAQAEADEATAAAIEAQNEADIAKAAAETAKTVSDKADADLTAAKADLETVSSRVDATEEDIIAAQQAVEAAQTAADKAKADASNAVTKAAEAQSKADTATTKANDALSTANIASSVAALAQTAADEAKEDASTAVSKADEAADLASEAQRIANNAATQANELQTRADEIAQAAANAQSQADTAKEQADQAAADLATAKQNLANVTSRVGATEADVEAAQSAVVTAQAAAEQAQREADAAQATADTAKANAAKAQTAANNAKTAADNAQSAADAAQQAADEAQAAVDALAVRVTTAETKITQTNEQISLMAKKTEVEQTLGGYYTKEQTKAEINASADSVKSTVSSTYATKQEVSGIEVGGRNYIRHGKGDVKEGFFTNFSKVENGYGEHTLTSQKTYSNISIAPGFVLGCRDYEPGRKVVFSYDIMFTEWDFPEGTTTNEWWIGQRYTGGTTESTVGAWRGVTNQVQPPKVGVNGCVLNEWFHVSNVLTIPEPAHESIGTTASIQFYNANADVAASMTFRIKNVKLEYGNKETDWTPAPEDVDTAVDEAQTTANQASESATEANERITTAESLIQQLSNSIAMLVTDENGESLMTQTENGWSFSMKETAEAVSSLTTLLETLQQQTGSTQATVSVLQQAINDHGTRLDYVSIGSYEEEPCIELGESDNDFKVLVTNTRVMFRHGANVPTLINTHGIVTKDIEVKGKIQQGNYAMMNTADGGWGLLWIGGGN